MQLKSIPTIISSTLIYVDKTLDILPVFSTANSLIVIFEKYAIIPLLTKKTIASCHYFRHIKEKKITDSLFLLVPVIGNIAVFILRQKRESKVPSEQNKLTTDTTLDTSVNAPDLTTSESPRRSVNHHIPLSPKKEAQTLYMLANKYAEGDGVHLNPEEAFRLFTLANEKGSHLATYKLGLCYLKGFGVKTDQQKAREHFLIAEKNEIGEASVQLGLIEKDLLSHEAKAHFYKASLKHDPDGLYYYSQAIKEFDPKESLRLLKLAADKDQPLANFELGKIYLQENDLTNALSQFEISSLKGNIEASYEAACILLNTPDENLKNVIQAIHHLTFASQNGHMDSKIKLAQVYKEYKIEGISDEGMTKFYESLARENIHEAIVEMAIRYEQGLGLKAPNIEKAIELHTKLAIKNHLESILWLYYRYSIDSNNEAQAYTYLNQACDLGDPEALFERYLITQDEAQKLIFLNQAAEAQSVKAIQELAKQEIKAGNLTEANNRLVKLNDPESLYLRSTLLKNSKEETDLKQKKMFLEGAAKENHLQAMYELALMIIEDEEEATKTDLDKAYEMLTKACNEGFADATLYLLNLHKNDLPKYKNYLEKLANENHPEACELLANYYLNYYDPVTFDLKNYLNPTTNTSFEKFILRSIKLLNIAIEGGREKAKTALAKAHYYMGLIHLKNNQKEPAIKSFNEANKNNDCDAAYSLACLYEDLNEASTIDIILPLIQKAAEGGNRHAQRDLAQRYLKGELGLKKDLNEARRLMTKANYSQIHISSIIHDLGSYVKAWLFDKNA